MARLRVPDELRDRINEFVDNAPSYGTQSEFVNEAIRTHLESKTSENENLDEDEIREIKRLIERFSSE